MIKKWWKDSQITNYDTYENLDISSLYLISLENKRTWNIMCKEIQYSISKYTCTKLEIRCHYSLLNQRNSFTTMYVSKVLFLKIKKKIQKLDIILFDLFIKIVVTFWYINLSFDVMMISKSDIVILTISGKANKWSRKKGWKTQLKATYSHSYIGL
jgi:hypothetical protein